MSVTQRDPNQILQAEHEETHDAKRVFVVGGQFDLKANISEFPKPEIITIEKQVIVKEPEIIQVEKQIIVSKPEIVEVEKQVIVKEVDIKVVEKPVIVEKIEYKEIQVPVIVEKFIGIPKSFLIASVLQSAALIILIGKLLFN